MGDRYRLFLLITVAVTCHASLFNGILSTADSIANIVNDIINLLTITMGDAYEIPNLLADQNFIDNAQFIEAQFAIGASNDETKLQFEDLVHKYGYPTERHEVVTDDGYILTLFRIPGSGPPVFLMHGMLYSSDDFVTPGRETALALLLADDGYDVWLGNARGNKHSRRHQTLNPANANFWNFSWHEIGIYDLPKMIDYILGITGKSSLKYIGHSQGTTSFFVMASERPEYNTKISRMIALSPIAFMKNTFSPVLRIAASANVDAALLLLGVNELVPDTVFMRALKQLLCGTGVTAELICSNIVFLISGFSYAQLNVTQLPVMYAHAPAGAATKQLSHYRQSINSGRFRKYDYGYFQNLLKYGSIMPSDYKLNKIVANVTLVYSDADWIASPQDVLTLHNKLSNSRLYQIPYHPFNHFDYIWAKDLEYLIYPKVKQILTS